MPSGIEKQLEQTDEAEIILILDESDIREHARRMRNALGVRNDTREIINEKAGLYNKKKDIILKAIAPFKRLLIHDYPVLPVLHLKVDRPALSQLLKMKEVLFVGENRAFSPFLSESLPLIHATDAQGIGATGSGAAVAVLDTGINYTNSAFGNCTGANIPGDCISLPSRPAGCRVSCVHDFAPDDGSLDANGHGTNVSGIVAGVAPDAGIIGLDVFSSNGYAYDSDILSALDWALANKDVYNIQAVNMSLGSARYPRTCPEDNLSISITNLKTAGVATVVSSGNSSYFNAISSPACVPDAVSAGAVYDANVGGKNWGVCSDSTTAADKTACFSNSASVLSLLAPGSVITSAGYTMSGTSMAAPHIAGSIAVVKGEYGSLSVDEAISRLTASGVAITDGKNNVVKPRVDVYGAVTLTEPFLNYAPFGFYFKAPQGDNPADQTLNISFQGAGTFDWSVSDDASWLTLSPSSGTNAGSVTVSVDTTGLTTGIYTALITIASSGVTNSPKTIPVKLELIDPAYVEDFEGGDLSALPWVTGGNGSWAVQNGARHSGVYAAKAPLIGENESSYLQVTLNITSSAYLRFWLKTSTEPVWDNVKFYVDGLSSYGKWDGWHGETDWFEERSEYSISAGIHTFKWVFSKINTISEGSDTIWLDDVSFPPFNLEIPNISPSPSSYDFGAVIVGNSSSPQIFTVSNIGTVNLNIGTISLTGTDASHFTKQNDYCSGQTVAPSGTCTVEARFSPQSTSVKNASLSIPSNDPDTPTLNLSLSGTGETLPLPVTDFSGSPISGAAPLTVGFTDLTANSPTSWSWTFGDGGVSAFQNPAHTYYDAGTYTVSLTATNASGSNTTTKTGYVTVSCPTQPARIAGTPPAYYATLQSAYDAAASGGTIQAQAATLNETLNLDSNVSVTLKGGYDSCYVLNSGGATTIRSLTISSGTVVVENLVLQ